MTKFKIGDKVRVIRQSHGWGTVEKGDIGVIVKLPGHPDNYYSGDFEYQKGWNGYDHCFELVANKQSKNERIQQLESKVTDYEKQLTDIKSDIKEITNLGEKIENLEKEIQELKNPKEIVQPVIDPVQPVIDPVQPEIELESVPVEMGKLKIGDRIKVVDNTATWGNSHLAGYHVRGQGTVKIGTIGQVVDIGDRFVSVQFDTIGNPRIKKLRGDEIELVVEVITFDGSDYKKVFRKAKEGDVIIMTKRYTELSNAFDVGVPYIVKPGCKITSSHWVHVCVEAYDLYTKGLRDTENIDVYEPLKKEVETITSESSFDVGDYVKIVRSEKNNTGAIAKITGVGSYRTLHVNGEIDNVPYKLELLTGENKGKEFTAAADQIELTYEKDTNFHRKQIIKEAKEFLAVHLTPNTSVPVWNARGAIKGFDGLDRDTCGIPTFFEINDERTIFLSIKGAGTDAVLNTTCATCNKSDVFNEHIGKAIALGRALGLDVEKFEQASQPSDIIPGMVVGMYSNDGTKDKIITITEVKGYRLQHENGWYHADRHMHYEWAEKPVILNDTNANY